MFSTNVHRRTETAVFISNSENQNHGNNKNDDQSAELHRKSSNRKSSFFHRAENEKKKICCWKFKFFFRFETFHRRSSNSFGAHKEPLSTSSDSEPDSVGQVVGPKRARDRVFRFLSEGIFVIKKKLHVDFFEVSPIDWHVFRAVTFPTIPSLNGFARKLRKNFDKAAGNCRCEIEFSAEQAADRPIGRDVCLCCFSSNFRLNFLELSFRSKIQWRDWSIRLSPFFFSSQTKRSLFSLVFVDDKKFINSNEFSFICLQRWLFCFEDKSFLLLRDILSHRNQMNFFPFLGPAWRERRAEKLQSIVLFGKAKKRFSFLYRISMIEISNGHKYLISKNYQTIQVESIVTTTISKWLYKNPDQYRKVIILSVTKRLKYVRIRSDVAKRYE